MSRIPPWFPEKFVEPAKNLAIVDLTLVQCLPDLSKIQLNREVEMSNDHNVEVHGEAGAVWPLRDEGWREVLDR